MPGAGLSAAAPAAVTEKTITAIHKAASTVRAHHIIFDL